jgi:dTDP-4-dehydrorhamnose reductase
LKKKILITGANGQVGQCLQALVPDFPQFDFILTDRTVLDISDKEAVQKMIALSDWCINCAAYTAVDKAESEAEAAQRINAVGARHLAEACAEKGIPLLHLSTDYVYHSHQNTPFREDDPVHPQGVYAATKLAGDLAVLECHPTGGMVVRTSWVYAPYGHNFMRTMLRLGSERASLNVVFDQIGTPTYAPDLAAALLHIIQKVENRKIAPESIAGIWHYSNEGVASWYDFAVAIMEIAQLPCKVMPIETKDYPTPAQRPPFSLLNKSKIKQAFGLEIPHWRESLTRGITTLLRFN